VKTNLTKFPFLSTLTSTDQVVQDLLLWISTASHSRIAFREPGWRLFEVRSSSQAASWGQVCASTWQLVQLAKHWHTFTVVHLVLLRGTSGWETEDKNK